ncbi:MAG: putative ABC transporter permease [Clostridia bacterium]|nr:putative ABC transporter permease [Clostridia bacterium]
MRRHKRDAHASKKMETEADTGTGKEMNTAGMGALQTIIAEDNEYRKKLFALHDVDGRRRLFMYGVEFVFLYIIGICMAFLGWVVENAAKMITQGIIDSRYHILPFISPYALIVFAFHVVVGDIDNFTFFGHKVFKSRTVKSIILSNVITLALFCSLTFLGELAVGNLWDKCFGVQLWNYTGQPMHVTQYAGLIPALGYGVGCYLLFRLVYTPVLGLVRRKMKYRVARIICLTLGIAIVLDTLRMMVCIMAFGEAPMLWSVCFR